MNPVLEHLPPIQQESFFAQAFDLPYFGTPWHYHPEFELVLVVKSSGKRFVGNGVSDFKEGDLSFLGPNLPHLYKNPADYYVDQNDLRAKSIVIHFLQNSFGIGFLSLPQAKKLRDLFDKSQYGIDIHGETKKVVIRKMKQLLACSGLKRLILLIEILDFIADSSEISLICSSIIKGNNAVDSERLDKVFKFVSNNFQQEIRLEDVAALTCMTRTSFCRFFMERTKRTFSDFLIDFRLNHATKLLIECNKTIVDISGKCGYSNLSNFNRQFKDKYGASPKEYRINYLKHV
jgi:AraC-like DNA-binding protein